MNLVASIVDRPFDGFDSAFGHILTQGKRCGHGDTREGKFVVARAKGVRVKALIRMRYLTEIDEIVTIRLIFLPTNPAPLR